MGCWLLILKQPNYHPSGGDQPPAKLGTFCFGCYLIILARATISAAFPFSFFNLANNHLNTTLFFAFLYDTTFPTPPPHYCSMQVLFDAGLPIRIRLPTPPP
jgi:hypothetical protein